MKTATPTPVHVTAELIRESIPGDCLHCAVAMALTEATGDPDAMVVEREWTLYLEVWGRYLIAPPEVRRFAYAYDGLARTEGGRAELPRKLTGEIAPFDFELPPLDSPDWEEACYKCEALFSPSELDDEGYCRDCHQKEVAE